MPMPVTAVQTVTLTERQVQHIVSTGDARQKKFVQIRIDKVDNPGLMPLSFKVYFQIDDGSQIYLGSFAIYPPENPGTFIVATQGKISGPGKILVKLVPLASVSNEMRAKVVIGSIDLVDSI